MGVIGMEWRRDEWSEGECMYAAINASAVRLFPEKATRFVESFCSANLFVSVTFDAVPIKFARISAAIPTFGSNFKTTEIPTRVHYGFAVKQSYQWVGGAHDAFFSSIAGRDGTWEADFDLSQCDADVLGLSFVIQLQNGVWIKSEGMDFYVGGGHRRTPCSVEIPFSEPPGFSFGSGRMMSLYRAKTFWLRPNFGASSLASCRHETQFVLVSEAHSREQESIARLSERSRYCVLLPLIDVSAGVRASLFGVEGGSYCCLRFETGRCSPLEATLLNNIRACVATYGGCPFDTIRSAISAAANYVTTFSSRQSKLAERQWLDVYRGKEGCVLKGLGFCTWDSHSHNVNQRGLSEDIRYLHAKGLPVQFVIVDDGWQEGGAGGPNCEVTRNIAEETRRPVLSSYRANQKFDGSLQLFSQVLEMQTIAWVAITGYWGGLSGTHCGIKTYDANGALCLGLVRNNEEDPEHWTKRYEVATPTAENLKLFFDNYFVKSLAHEQYVSGVKVDAQSILEILCNPATSDEQSGQLSRAGITLAYRNAMTDAAERAFTDTIVINCMACGPETIFCSGRILNCGNVCWRSSDDHAFPGVEETAESVSWHILSNAMNSLMLGEIFPVLDWDMFRACDRYASIHAAARVISGGPIYFSDKFPLKEEEEDQTIRLLMRLVTSDGHLVLCTDPGRPSIDCLFDDPRRKPPRLFTVFNRNAVTGLLGIFNLDSSRTPYLLNGIYSPANVEDFAHFRPEVEYVSYVAGDCDNAYFHRNARQTVRIHLSSMSCVLVHICPVFKFKGVKVAFIGQPRLLNCGGALQSITIAAENASSMNEVWAEGVFCDYGETHVWVDSYARSRLTKVTTSESKVIEMYSFRNIGGLDFLVVEVPKHSTWSLRLWFSI